jgi:hypothetical protein
MEDQTSKTQPLPASGPDARHGLAKFGLWLAVGFVGVNGIVAGVIQLFDGGAKPMLALSLLSGGAVLAAVSWWRGQAAIDAADGAPTATVGALVHTRAGAAAGV